MLLPDLNTQLTQLADYLAGEFDNRTQSLADPAWYLHLRVWNQPLPRNLFPSGYGFFIEQVNVAASTPPYRQRLLHLTIRDNQLWGQYYGLQDPLTWRGSATEPARLATLTAADLVDLPTCGLGITAGAYEEPVGPQFVARLPAETLCSITYEGKASYISLGFDIGPATHLVDQLDRPLELRVYDHGVDAATGAKTWGPKMGPFQLVKQRSFPLANSPSPGA
ncbi:MAG: CpcT/CpeT family chromophore lyase [Nodosilinea sp.]